MSKFEGFEVVPTASLGSSHGDAIKITVSAVRVSIPKALIVAMGNPSNIAFHRGVGENEGRIIIAADDSGIRLDLGKKKISFSHSEFSDTCVKMIQTYVHGSFRRGSYYSISGVKISEGAYIFDFRNAMEHNVRMWGGHAVSGRNGAQVRPYNMQGQFK